jgi:alkaline phosphatase D
LTHGVQSGDATAHSAVVWTPEAVFVHAPPRANTSPAEGYQHFGEVSIDGDSGVLTVDLRDREGVSLWSRTLPAPPGR